jgi:hypothetical protein
MLPGTSDELFVRAIVNDQSFEPAKVHFVTENQTEYKAGYDSKKGGWTLNLVAPPANDGQLVYVVYEKAKSQYSTLAILKVLTYEPKEVNVMLVPVNKHNKQIDVTSIQNEANAIYNKFGVTVNIKVSGKEFNYTPIDGETFQVDGTGLFATRTSDMDALEEAFKKTGQYNDHTVYLFVMDKPSNVPNTVGDMPRDSRMGYLFPSYTARTIAHEIGHGVFNLKHPFAKGILTNQFNEGELKDNLMDYPIGTGLAKLQWDALHSPGIVIGLFEKDGDAMSAENNYIILEQDGVFFTPAGNPFTLKAGSKIYAACMDYKRFPSWAVYIFESDDKTYNTNYRDNLSAGIDFDCYYQKDNQKNKYPLPAEVKGKATFIRFDKLEGDNLCITLLQEEVDNIYRNTGSSTISFSRKPQTGTLIEIDKSNSLNTSSCPELLDEAKQQVSNNSNSTSGIEDKANKLTSEQREYLKNKLESIKSQTGVSWKIIITGNNSDKKAAEEEGAESKQPILHLHYEENGEINGNIYGGDKSGYIPINNDFIQKLITPLRPLEGAVGKMLEGLSFIIGKASIPDKYYNPKSKDGYDDILATVYSAANENYETAQIEIAFVCGLWNGLVGAVQALPDGANLVNDGVVLCMDAIFNKGTARQDIKKFWETDKWEKIKEVADIFYQNIKEEVTDNPPMISYYTGRVVFDVATIYLSVAKVGKLSSIVNAIEKFDIFAQALGKVMKATGVVIRQSGRFINASLQSGYTFMRLSARSGNLYCGIPIPIGEGGTKAYKEAVEKFKEKWNKGVINAEEIIVKADDAGNPLLDEKGLKVGYYEQDGEKIFVLLDESVGNLPEGVVDNMLHNLDYYLMKIKQKIGEKQAKQLAKDFADNIDIISKIADDDALLNAWNKLNENGRKLVRVNIRNLEHFAKLSDEVQETLIKFSDETLAKFMDDIVANTILVNFVNNPEYLRLVRGFVAHKLDESVIQDIGGFLADEGLQSLAKAEQEFAEKWLQHSKEYAKFSKYVKLGNELSDNIVASLYGKTKMFNDLAKKLGMSVDKLSLYEIFREVPLNTANGFMKADALLIKRNTRGAIEDVILIENKLSKGTAYTERQIEGLTAIGKGEKMTVRYGHLEGNLLTIDKSKCFRFDDHGTNNIGKVDIEQVNFSKFK